MEGRNGWYFIKWLNIHFSWCIYMILLGDRRQFSFFIQVRYNDIQSSCYSSVGCDALFIQVHGKLRTLFSPFIIPKLHSKILDIFTRFSTEKELRRKPTSAARRQQKHDERRVSFGVHQKPLLRRTVPSSQPAVPFLQSCSQVERKLVECASEMSAQAQFNNCSNSSTLGWWNLHP